MRLTDLQKQELICDYKCGMTWDGLCEKWNTNTHIIHKILKTNNISRTRIKDSTWCLEKQQLLKDMYNANCTYQEMYAALGCKGGDLTYWVHKLDLPMRGSGRNSVYPNKFLARTPESDYWLGYIFADGHVGIYKKPGFKNACSYYISLTSEKEYVVNEFKKWYDDIPTVSAQSYTIKDGTTKKLYKAYMGSKDLVRWFRDELHIDNVKHHTLNPNIDITWDMIRGFFDGDGSSSKGEWQLKSCSKTWLSRIQSFLSRYNIESTLCKSYLDCWGLFVRKKESLRKLIPLMYEHNYFCHKYKYLNFEPLISNDEVNIG